MALRKGKLERKIKAVLRDSLPEGYDRDSIDNERINNVALALADAIHDYISDLRITIPIGQIVVAGPPAGASNPSIIILRLSTLTDLSD